MIPNFNFPYIMAGSEFFDPDRILLYIQKIKTGIEYPNHAQKFILKPNDLLWSPVAELEHCEPSLVFDKDNAQVLMDSLWHCGLRPTEGAGSAGAMDATRRHLDDMRKITFDLLQKER